MKIPKVLTSKHDRIQTRSLDRAREMAKMDGETRDNFHVLLIAASVNNMDEGSWEDVKELSKTNLIPSLTEPDESGW